MSEAMAPIRHGTPVVLYRRSIMEPLELDAAEEHFDCYESVCDVPDDTLVIVRFSALPFYAEVARDIAKRGSVPLNSFRQHRYAADLGAWYADLKDLTPRTYKLEDMPDKGPFVLKGETNSMRHLWKTHMFAENKVEAIQVASRLMSDGVVGQQTIYARDFVPLETFGIGVDGVPISREHRFFVLDGHIVSSGFYWANHTDWIIEQGHRVPEPSEVPREFLQRATAAVGDNIRFYTMDVAKTASGDWIVIELNDGQQSGLSDNDPRLLYGGLYARLAGLACKRCGDIPSRHCPACGSCPPQHLNDEDGTFCQRCGSGVL